MEQVQHRVLASMPPEVINPKMTRRMLWGERLMGALLEFKACLLYTSPSPRD